MTRKEGPGFAAATEVFLQLASLKRPRLYHGPQQIGSEGRVKLAPEKQRCENTRKFRDQNIRQTTGI